jgi:exodeoxyribonuclease V gamma subunit
VLVAGGAPAGSVDVRVELPDGRLLSGTVSGVSGDLLRTTTFSRVSAKHRVAAWVRLLALTAAEPGRPFAAATIGRAEGRRVRIARIHPLGQDAAARRAAALGHLATLVDLHDRGMREPLPLYCLTSAAYAEAAAAGRDPAAAAEREWTSEWNRDREDAEPEHQLVLTGVMSFDDLLAEPPHAGEDGAGWEVAETSRLGRCARRMWDGLLAAEEVTVR